MNKNFTKTIVILLISLTPLFSYSASIGKSPSVLPLSNCTSGLSCGLVGYWTFDGKDVVNGVVRDNSGNGNNANLSNIATSTFFVPGKIGQGFNFDGSNDALNAGSAAVLDNLSAMTLSVWVKLNSYGAGGGGYLINKGDNNSGGHGWSLSVSQSNGLITFTARYNTTSLLSQGAANTFSLSDMNKWVHIMVTWDGSANSASGVHIYKNGSEISYSSQVNGSSSYLSDAADNLNIGDGGLISGRQSNGIFDDVRIYNRVLSARELSQIYNSGASSKQSASMPAIATSTCSYGLSCGLVGYWTFDGKDVVNGVVRDNSGNSGRGNLINISTSTFYTQGKIGQGFDFNSNSGLSDQYISVNQSVSLDNLTNITACFWMKPAPRQSVTYPVILVKGNFSSNYWDFYFEGPNAPYALGTSFNGGAVYAQTTNIVPANVWSHVCIIQEGTNSTNFKFYYNGRSISQNQNSGNTARSNDSGINLSIGSEPTGNNRFNSKVDDVRIYNRVLSASEITQLYSVGAQTKQSTSMPIIATSTCSYGLSCGLVGYWTFDGKDMVNGVVQDKSRNTGRGNLKNIATSTFYTYGKIGQGFNFDGVDDYLDVTASATDNLSSFTVCSWIKPKKYQPQSGGFPILVVKGSNDTTNYWDVYLEGSTGPFEFGTSYDNGNKGYFQTGPVILPDVWSHICVIQNGTIAANFLTYLNGASTPNGGDLGGSGGSHPTDTGAHVIIGSDITNNKYSGLMDDVRIYNRALSESEIKQIYNHGK
jgi:hypothetical protein